MDGRCLVLLTSGLLGIVGGCTHTSPLRQPKHTTNFAQVDDSGVIEHKAPTYCAFGDMMAAAAVAADKSPEQRRLAREEAKLSYLKAIETDPKHLVAYLSLARMQQNGEEYEAAIATYDKALTLAPKDASIWYDLGLCRCRMKQWNESIDSLQKACELNPGNRTYQSTLGYALGRAGRVQESLAVLSRVHGEAKANYDLARLMKHVHQLALAKQFAAAAVAKDPTLDGAAQLLAELNGEAKSSVIQTAAYVKAAQSSHQDAPPPTIIQATTGKQIPGLTQPEGASSSASVKANQGDESSAKPIKLPPVPVINFRK